MLNRASLLSPLIAVPFIYSLTCWEKKPKLPFSLLTTHRLVCSSLEKKRNHRRAVHLALSARWCQDRRWPKACRTESSSESLFSLPVPPWHLPATGNLGEPFDRRWFQHTADAAHKFPVIQTNQGRWGMKRRPPASVFNGLRIYFPYILRSRWGASPLSSRGLISQSDSAADARHSVLARSPQSEPQSASWMAPSLTLDSVWAEWSFARPCFGGAKQIQVEVRRLTLVPHRPQREGISNRKWTLLSRRNQEDGGTVIFSISPSLFIVQKKT